MLHTDEAAAYADLDGLFFRRESVNHSRGEYVRGDVTTNGVESVFAVLKQGTDPVKRVPKPLNQIADKVLSYRPKPISTPAKKRRRKAKKAQRESSV